MTRLLNTKRGNELMPHVQRECLGRFVHRMTVESQRQYPEFARYMRLHGWRMPDRTDAEWLAATDFYVTRNGELDKRYSHCETHYEELQK